MWLEAFLQHLLQIGIHELKIIVDVQADHSLAMKRARKPVSKPFIVPRFHGENHIRPTDVTFVNTNARVLFSASGTDDIAVKTVIHFFGSETAPAILTANEENF